MKIAVRYYSKLGNTKAIAEAIAEEAGVPAISIVDETELKEHYDLLFIGGAPYANIMAPALREYAKSISPDNVDRIVLFTTSNWSRRTVRALKRIFLEKGIVVEEDYFYAHMTRIKAKLAPAKQFARKMIDSLN